MGLDRKEYYKEYRKKNKQKIKQYFEQNKKRLTAYRKKHYTGLYGSWYAMKQRCDNPNNKAYKNYGGRGITYNPEWEQFENFKRDMESTYKRGLTLERINNNGNYYKGNCRWATRRDQCNNQRKTVYINGKTFTELEKEIGVDRNVIRSRYYRGMSEYQILHPHLYRPWKLN